MEDISIKNLSFKYPSSEDFALNSITLDIKYGDFVVVCGESGCGKTTLLRLLKREIAPTGELSGEILYNGADMTQISQRTSASEIGYVMQNPQMQIVTDKVWHEMAFGLENLGVPQADIRRRVAEMADYFGIEGWFRRGTDELSGGQKQLLNLASVMVMQPKVLILDEPTSQLDPIAAADFTATLKRLNNEFALTVILAEHRLEEVFPIADRVLVMSKGRAVMYADPKEVGASAGKCAPELVYGLPCSVRIYNELGAGEKCPMTVKEGREYLSRNFKDDIKRIDCKRGECKKDVAVSLKNVWFRYERNGQDILRDVELDIFKGEIMGILGGNGAGKSTVLKVIAGQKHAWRGVVKINGKKIEKYKSGELYRGNIALLAQNPQEVFLKNSLWEDFSELAEMLGYDKADAQKHILDMCEKMQIKELLKKHPYDLSGGQMQKAALAKILLLNPKILLLDEPTKGIDAYSKQKLGKLLKTLSADGITVVAVTHDVEFAAEFADRCAMLFDGEIMSADVPNVFFSNNNFYTTAASRISRHMYENTVLCGDVVRLCRENGVK